MSTNQNYHHDSQSSVPTANLPTIGYFQESRPTILIPLKVIATLGIVSASGSMVYAITGIVAALTHLPFSAWFLAPYSSGLTAALQYLTGANALLLFVAGIECLRDKPGARRHMLIYAVAQLILGSLSIGSSTFDLVMRIGISGDARSFALAIGSAWITRLQTMILPCFVLVLFPSLAAKQALRS